MGIEGGGGLGVSGSWIGEESRGTGGRGGAKGDGRRGVVSE